MTLNRLGVPAIALHSQIKQRERTASLAKFKSNTVRVLFTTDVGSRGESAGAARGLTSGVG